jgi:predicted acetyltransferase
VWEDKTVLCRLLELYQYDMSEIWPQTLNAHGEYGFAVDRYLRNPRLRAFLFLADGDYAGFGLVDPDVSLPGNEFWMGQFFVMKRYRREVGNRPNAAQLSSSGFLAPHDQRVHEWQFRRARASRRSVGRFSSVLRQQRRPTRVIGRQCSPSESPQRKHRGG